MITNYSKGQKRLLIKDNKCPTCHGTGRINNLEQKVIKLFKQGLGIRQITDTLEVKRVTVKHYLIGNKLLSENDPKNK